MECYQGVKLDTQFLIVVIGMEYLFERYTSRLYYLE